MTVVDKKPASPRRDAAGICNAVFGVFLLIGGILFFTSSDDERIWTFTGLGMAAFAAVGWLLLAIFGPDHAE